MPPPSVEQGFVGNVTKCDLHFAIIPNIYST